MLHYYHLTPVDVAHPYPHPDICQLVVEAIGTAHAGDPDTWADTDGWEQRAWLAAISAVEKLPLTAAERYFIDLDQLVRAVDSLGSALHASPLAGGNPNGDAGRGWLIHHASGSGYGMSSTDQVAAVSVTSGRSASGHGR